MPTRSTKLAASLPPAAISTLVLTVPAGLTYLVKSCLVYNPGAGVDTVQVWAVDAGGVVGGWMVYQAGLAVSGRVDWEGWLALNPGDQLYVASATGHSHFWISGTKLPGIA